MPSFKNSVALAGAFAAKVYAHGLVAGFNTDGVYNQGFILDYYYSLKNTGSYPKVPGWYEEAVDKGFVAPSAYGEPDIICHINGQNVNATTATVSAGGTIDFFWTTWPDSHIGPILTYVANCGDTACNRVNKTSLEWVKIDEAGIDLDTQIWAATALIANNNTYTMTVPSTLASGSYVFRHEIIAMHGASGEGGAQNYPFCINIDITGGGSDTPAGILGTELYTSTEPGILFNPYTTLTEYTPPGPALWTGGSGSTSGTTDSSESSDSTGSAATTAGAAPPSATTPSAAPPAAATVVDTALAVTTGDAESPRCKRRRRARQLKVPEYSAL